MAGLCYICREELIDAPPDYRGPLEARHRTRDHVPPKGLFLDPKPDNLICVSCCNACNGEQSGFDERFRILVASEINANAAGRKIMAEKVLGSTMAKGRQPKFVAAMATTMRDTTLKTPFGEKEISTFSTRSDEIFPGVIRITKGLLAHFHPGYDYRKDEFFVLDIHSGTLAKGDALRQIAVVKALVNQTQPDQRGSAAEFRFWRQVEKTKGMWLLVFYEAMHFVVSHHTPSEQQPVKVESVSAGG